MPHPADPLLEIMFLAEVIEWRGPAPYVFVVIPDRYTGDVRRAARQASYGWGVVPVEATVATVTFRTSLFPRGGDTYLLPLRIDVRRQAEITLGDDVNVSLRVYAPT